MSSKPHIFRDRVLALCPNAKLYNAVDERKGWRYCYFVSLDGVTIPLIPVTSHSPYAAWRRAYALATKQCPIGTVKSMECRTGRCYLSEGCIDTEQCSGLAGVSLPGNTS